MSMHTTLRRAEERGAAHFGWLDSRHTFSFGNYHDPRFMGFGPLRVINEDRVRPGAGFGTHGHRDMEIVSWVLEGALEHRDSTGGGSVIRPGDVQRMTAGTGIRHSEFNASQTEPVHFLQLWIEPERAGLEPGYEQEHVPEALRRGRLALLASREGRDGSVSIHQDVDLWAGLFGDGESAGFELRAGRSAWIHVARGSLRANGTPLEGGDGLAVRGPGVLTLEGAEDAEVLIFDLVP